MRRGSLVLLFAALLYACKTADPTPGVDTGADAGADMDSGADNDSGVVNDDSGGNPTDSGNNPDTGNPADSGILDECNPVDQTGCDTPPQTKCVVEGGSPGAECVEPSPNDVGLGEECTGEDCDPGLACIRDAQTSTLSHCRNVCNLDTNVGCEALGAEYECRTSITQSNWGACTMLPPTCDPLTQAPCDANQACQPFLRRTGTWEFRCRTAGNQAEGDVCGGNNACARELACVNQNGMPSCVRFCDEDMDCTNPLTCTGTVTEPPFNFCKM
jgi:hypothetical protein